MLICLQTQAKLLEKAPRSRVNVDRAVHALLALRRVLTPRNAPAIVSPALARLISCFTRTSHMSKTIGDFVVVDKWMQTEVLGKVSVGDVHSC
jgi:hypothetical protein